MMLNKKQFIADNYHNNIKQKIVSKNKLFGNSYSFINSKAKKHIHI